MPPSLAFHPRCLYGMAPLKTTHPTEHSLTPAPKRWREPSVNSWLPAFLPQLHPLFSSDSLNMILVCLCEPEESSIAGESDQGQSRGGLKSLE